MLRLAIMDILAISEWNLRDDLWFHPSKASEHLGLSYFIEDRNHDAVLAKLGTTQLPYCSVLPLINRAA